MDASLKNICIDSFGVTYTAYYILGGKETAALRYGFQLAQFKSTPTPS